MLFTSKFRLVTHMIAYFFFNYIHQILVHCHSACFSNHTLDSLKRDMNITLITLERICKYPDCTPDDVIKLTEWNCRPPFPFGWGGLQYWMDSTNVLPKAPVLVPDAKETTDVPDSPS